MASQTLNIQAGERITEVCHIVKRGRGYQIEDTFSFLTPPGTVKDGAVIDSGRYANELVSEIRKHNLQNMKNVIFTVTTSRLASREVITPPVKENVVRQMVHENAHDYFPVDKIEDYDITYTKVGEQTGDQKGHRLLVQIIPKEILNSFAEVAERCSLRILAIDTSLNSIYQSLRALKDSGVTIYVNITEQHTEVTALSGGEYLMQRPFKQGGDVVIENYMRELDLPNTEYSRVINELTPEKIEALPSTAVEKINDDVERFLTPVSRIVDLLRARYNVEADRIVLLGSGCRTPLIFDHLKKMTTIPVMFLDELPELSGLTNSRADASAYIACIGSSMAPVDFMPDAVRQQQTATSLQLHGSAEGSKSLTFPIIIAGVCAVAGIALIGVGSMQLKASQDKLSQMQARIKTLQPAKDTYDAYVTYTANQKNIDVVKDLAKGKNADLNAVLAELEAKMPSSILVGSASFTQSDMNLDVTVPDKDTAAVVIDQLRNFESFDVISVSGVTQNTTESGTSACTFSVDCKYPAEKDSDGDGIPDKNDPNPKQAASSETTTNAQ
jgi:type IV pilus assembly protein PilM